MQDAGSIHARSVHHLIYRLYDRLDAHDSSIDKNCTTLFTYTYFLIKAHISE